RAGGTALLALAVMLASLGSLAPTGTASATDIDYYDATYRATFEPGVEYARVELELAGKQLPSKVVLLADSRRYRHFRSSDPLQVHDKAVVWHPRCRQSTLRYEFRVNHQRSSGKYASYITEKWALFRGDKLAPAARVTAESNLHSRTTLELDLPKGWSAVTPY